MNAAVMTLPRTTPGLTTRALGLGPALAVVALLLVLPLVTLLRYSFNRFTPQQLMAEAFTLENYVRFASEPYYRAVLGTTFGVATLCVLTTLILGFPLAYHLARTRSRWKSMLVVL